ncbi:hypothetical protein C3B55_00642 [Candidatus Pseudomonas adelgestsugas]|uniref:Uncharacterized protein n=1 Tax=Candidatus Pseudomonas adelgestsugas TaxID=1302376 RepID=A0ABX5R967_9PSED|nr:hypothetical protein C3B55_00642 [Candidatus Pseudomonas adelgestsugas]
MIAEDNTSVSYLVCITMQKILIFQAYRVVYIARSSKQNQHLAN